MDIDKTSCFRIVANIGMAQRRIAALDAGIKINIEVGISVSTKGHHAHYLSM